MATFRFEDLERGRKNYTTAYRSKAEKYSISEKLYYKKEYAMRQALCSVLYALCAMLHAKKTKRQD